MKNYITCPECGNRFPIEIKSNSDGARVLAECGECEASIELIMHNGIPKIENWQGATWDIEHLELRDEEADHE
jgi:transcription elongation factor Elf1